jgi:hypothetical protein
MYYTITEVSIRFPFSSSGLALFREDSILAQRPSEKAIAQNIDLWHSLGIA